MKELSMDEIKKMELDILSDVHDYCVANGIHYILFAGSLLGAVRHKGIIPWDDDIDIAMPRPDYERFVATYQDDRYIVKTIDNSDDFVFTFSKVIDNSTVLIENKTEQSKIGINIDIFPLDGLPGDEDEAENAAEKSLRYKKLISIKQMKYRKGRRFFKNAVLFFGKLALLPFSYRHLNEMAIKNAKRYPYDGAKYVANLAWGIGKKGVVKKEWVLNRHIAPFENIECFIPDRYDEFLTKLYGDYMTPPPVEQRGSHHLFKVYYRDDYGK